MTRTVESDYNELGAYRYKIIVEWGGIKAT